MPKNKISRLEGSPTCRNGLFYKKCVHKKICIVENRVCVSTSVGLAFCSDSAAKSTDDYVQRSWANFKKKWVAIQVLGLMVPP